MVAGGRGELQLEERVENLFYCTADKIFFHQDGSFSFNLGFFFFTFQSIYLSENQMITTVTGI